LAVPDWVKRLRCSAYGSRSDDRAIYSDPSVVERYRSISGLQPVEATIIYRIGHEFVDKRILDLGVGAGRTTPYLLEISKNIFLSDPALQNSQALGYPQTAASA
jgi:hypothetical protein